MYIVYCINSNTVLCRQSNVGHLVPACEDKQCKVLECYRNNSNRTLQCSQEVHQYIKCVENARKVNRYFWCKLFYLIVGFTSSNSANVRNHVTV